MNKFVKFFIIVSIVMILPACGKYERFVATTTGYSTICVNGVQYIQFTSGATVMYNRDGSIVTC